jgi:excinuclease ABC subunit C
MANMEKFRYSTRKDISKLPKSAGVYSFSDGKKTLYIGKAGNIRERVKNHFNQPSYRDDLYIDKVKKIGCIKTGSEIEALILEAELIKKRQPGYNVIWKDDKNYFYVGITKEDFPRVFITHQPKIEESRTLLIGPFVDGKSLKETLKVLRKVFPYRSCRQMPKHACLWYQLDRCPAPCLFRSNLARQIEGGRTLLKFKKEYQGNIKKLAEILKGKKRRVLKEMEGEMKKLSREEKFEEAGKIKNQICSLKRVFSHARIFELNEAGPLLMKEWPHKRAEAYDIANIQGSAATGSMVVFTNGQPDKSQYRKFKIRMENKPNDVAMIKEVLSRRLRHAEWPRPDFILIDGGKAQLNAAKEVLSKLPEKEVGQIKVAALAKRNNELFSGDKKGPVLLKNAPREFSDIILQMRDEAHRFARSYHHKLREVALKPRS